ncbi:MAG: peptidase M23 [Gammaproteobacteria bacterium HGW-Gammaproteobacteria-3]|nr:MAG: peptidase M23 [Gammaproteobacteria bacterium HGW-Gammaproteobacteria-3]
MKNRIYKSLFLGIGSAVVASASYALIALQTETNSADISVFTQNATLIQPTNPIEKQLDAGLKKITGSAEPALIKHTIKRGESLSSIFSTLDLSKADLHKIIHANATGKQFTQISFGKTLQLKIDNSGRLQQLIYKKNALETLSATREIDSFNVEISSKQLDKQIANVTGTIHSSLFQEGKEAGLPDKVILQLAEIFAWDIDFALDIKENDSFSILYEKFYAAGKEVGSGAILAAEFINQGTSYRAVRYQDKQGHAHYYTPEGNGMRKAFIRTPVDFARISSPFNLKRRHPVLNRIRAHKGVDYAAVRGTPIKCTGDGKIIFQGRQNGYGRVIIIQHGEHYSTLYAHLSAFSKNFKTGSTVKQSDIIGYVGQSGLASGPHLHYEFRIDGEHRDPLTVKLPNSAPVSPALLADFKAATRPLLAQLELSNKTLLAQNQP